MAHGDSHPILLTPVAPLVEVKGESDVNELSSLTLTCIVKAAPAPVITWLRRTKEEVAVLLGTARTSISTQYNPSDVTATSVLTIRRATPADQGNFICEAINEVAPTNIGAAKTVEISGKYCG